jgi:hypothetical protein
MAPSLPQRQSGYMLIEGRKVQQQPSDETANLLLAVDAFGQAWNNLMMQSNMHCGAKHWDGARRAGQNDDVDQGFTTENPAFVQLMKGLKDLALDESEDIDTRSSTSTDPDYVFLAERVSNIIISDREMFE